MAKQNLLQELKTVRKAIEKNSASYRALVSDKMTHAIVINVEDIKNQIKAQLEAIWSTNRKFVIPPTLLKEVNIAVDKMPEQYKKVVESINSDKNSPFSAKFIERGDNLYIIVTTRDKSKGLANVFNKIRTEKLKIEKYLVYKINTYATRYKKELVDSANFIDLGHLDSYSVSKQRRELIKDTLSKYSKSEIAKEVEDIAVELKMQKYLHGRGYSFRMILTKPESSRLNRSKEEERLLGSLSKDLEEVIAKRSIDGEWVNLPGSDSPLTIFKKKVLRSVKQLFSKTGLFKVFIKDRDIKVNDRRTEAEVSYKKKGKVGSITKLNFDSKLNVPDLEVQESTVSIKNLIPIFNKRLHDAIQDNMGTPRLNYRTGRFAKSAKVIDITETRAGYPSIAYTYMRYPYEVFEFPGGNPDLATPARDPRSLIDKSIRDIAKGLIKDRFYTRRV